jgi:hypothetical protein
MAEVFISHMVVLVSALEILLIYRYLNVTMCLVDKNSHLIADSEFRDKSWIGFTLFAEDGLIRVPPHDSLKHRIQESSIAVRFVFSASCYAACNVTEDLKRDIGVQIDFR